MQSFMTRNPKGTLNCWIWKWSEQIRFKRQLTATDEEKEETVHFSKKFFLMSVNFQPVCKNCKISNGFCLQYPLHLCSKIEIGFEISFLISFGLENECRLLTQCLFPSILKTSHGTTWSVLSTLAILILKLRDFWQNSHLCFLHLPSKKFV